MGILVPIPDYDDSVAVQEIVARVGYNPVAIDQLNRISRRLESASAQSDDFRESFRAAIVSAQRSALIVFTQRFNQDIRYPPELGVILNFRPSGNAHRITRYVEDSLNRAWKLHVPGFVVQRFIEERRERVSSLELGTPQVDSGSFRSDTSSHRQIDWALCCGLFATSADMATRALLFAFLADQDRPY
jgi:hypothetical protein